MRFFKETTKYVKKNFLRLLPYAILPAVAMALAGRLGSALTFFFRYSSEVSSYTVWDIYKYFSVLLSENWLMGLSALIVVGFFMCLMYGAIDRHMKVGKFSYKNMFSRLNETVMAVGPAYFVLFALLELVALLNSSLIFIFTRSMGFNSIYVAIPITMIMYGCLFLGLTQFVILIPSEIVVGYPFKDAVINSVRLVSGKITTVWWQMLVIVFAPALVSALTELIFLNRAVVFFVDVAMYLLILIFTTSYMMVAYFILSDEPRRDVEEKKKYLT